MTDTTKTRISTGEVRLSYAHLFAPQAGMNGGEPKYKTAILIPKSDKKTIRAIEAAVDAAAAKAAHLWNGKRPANLKTPLRDGDAERPDDPAYEGHYFLNCSSSRKPGIVDRRLRQITNPDEVYSGCYARVSLDFYGYSVNGNRGIAAGLGNVQKLRDGDSLLGGAAPSSDFDALDDDDLEDDFLD